METNTGHGSTCNCSSCQWDMIRTHHMGYRIARKFFILFLLVTAFWFGTRYGEIRAVEGRIRSQGRMMMEMGGGAMQGQMPAATPVAPTAQ